MSPTRLPSRARAGARFPFVAALLLPALPLLPLLGAQQQIERADFAQAEKYSPQFLRQFTYSTSVTPQWIGDSDRFWYQYRTSAGTRFWLVDCEARTRVPLFDHDELAALLSEACRKALDATNLELRNAAVDAAGKKLTFVAEGQRFQFDFETRALAAQGRAPAPPSPPAPGAVADGTGREGSQRGGGAPPAQRGGAAPRADHRVFSPDRRHYVFAKGFDLYLASGTEVVAQAGPAAVPAEPTDPAVASQLDGKTAAAALSTQTTEDGTGNGTGNGNGNAAVAVAAQAAAAKPAAAPATAAPRFTYDEAAAVRLTTDGEERYTFAAGAPRPAGRQEQQEREQQQDQNEQDQQQQEERQDSQRQDSQRQLGQREDGGRTGARTADRSATAQPLPASERTSRPSATWSKDSVAFHATRRDSRGVGELFLVDSLAQPRPSLQQYDYPMPGEDAVRKTELWYGAPSAAAPLQRLAPKWKDESYTDVHFLEDGHELRFLRRDRLVRNAELCALDPLTGKVRVLIAEQTADANLITQPVRYVKGKGRMIWWSERSGWGHYYLYDLDGKLLNPITKGAFRASAIVDVDEDKGILWFRGNAREPG